MASEKIKIQNIEITLSRQRLKKWSSLEGVKAELDTAISKYDPTLIFYVMVKFIEIAVSSSPSGVKWEEVPWYDFISIYTKAVNLNLPSYSFPILSEHGGGEQKKLPWEYEGRNWYFWYNLFAKNYGWDEPTIAELDIDDALGLYQEIQLDDQLQREWEWGLSEIAYSYDKSTKTSKYKPLTRPSWMMPMIPKQLPVIRMKQSHIPVGNIIDLTQSGTTSGTKST